MNYRAPSRSRPFPAALTQWHNDYPGGPLYLPDGFGNNLSFLGWDCYARAGTFHNNGCIEKKIWWWDADHWESSLITAWLSSSHVQVADNQGETSGFPYVTRWGRLPASIANLALWLGHGDDNLTGLRAAGQLPWRSTIHWSYLWSTWNGSSSPWTDFPLTAILL